MGDDADELPGILFMPHWRLIWSPEMLFDPFFAFAIGYFSISQTNFHVLAVEQAGT